MIKFRCPQGHPLAAPANRAGKSGQCPRCQRRFVVPAATAPEHAEAIISAADTSDEQGHWPADGGATDSAPAKFMFLCPNGHKLFGPPTLQGRPGQCPHCNARFLIPDVREESAADSPGEDEDMFPFPVGDLSDLSPDAQLNDESESGTGPKPSSVMVPEGPPPPPMVSCHPWAQIMRRVRTETGGAGQLEVQLSDGTLLIAESFSAELSQHEHGVFAMHAEDLTSSVVVVPWDHVTRITIKHLCNLPLDLRFTLPANPRRPDRLP
ncbi:MAG: hypothetical protein ACYC6N_01805 [Pirellulaceae bacterium]